MPTPGDIQRAEEVAEMRGALERAGKALTVARNALLDISGMCTDECSLPDIDDFALKAASDASDARHEAALLSKGER